MRLRYFDANATTMMLPSVVAAFTDVASLGPLNPSSAHSMGDKARSILSDARDAVGSACGASDPDNIYFVSGGTEANNLVINGFAKIAASRILYSSVEHASVIEPASAHGGSPLPVGRDGILDLDLLRQLLACHPDEADILVCVQAANSETGVVQPIEGIAEICSAASDRVYLHVDAAQAFGRIQLPIGSVDSLSFSGHKLHAPSGSGFLYLSDRMAELLPRTVLGGAQEKGVRSGTQNVAAIAGLAAAVSDRFSDFNGHTSYLASLRDRFEEGLLRQIADLSVIGAGAERTPNTSNLRFPGVEAMALMARLDDRGIISSNGSACSSLKPSPSHVLTAMGLSEAEAFTCLRFSFSVLNSEEEATAAVDEIAKAYAELKALHEH